MQAASDIFLGWQRTTEPGGAQTDYYLRQLRGLEVLRAHRADGSAAMATYGELCGWDAGPGPRPYRRPVRDRRLSGRLREIRQAVADFGESYADQAERDHTALAEAAASGRVQATTGVLTADGRRTTRMPGRTSPSDLGYVEPFSSRAVLHPRARIAGQGKGPAQPGRALEVSHRAAAEPWSDEHPRLYSAVLSGPGGDVSFRIGFRRVEVRDGQIRLNGHAVQFRGVNRPRVASRDRPYVRPQENGNRMHARSLSLSTARGTAHTVAYALRFSA